MILNIDIETYSSVDLSSGGVYKYVESSDFEILLFGYRLNGEEVKVLNLDESLLPESIINLLYDVNVIKTAFNANFEYTCINEYLKRLGRPPMDFRQWEDTMLLAHYAGYSGGLDNVAKALRLKVQKDSAGTRLINKFSKPHKPNSRDKRVVFRRLDDPIGWAKFIEYNKRDVEVESAIRDRLKDIKIPDSEITAYRLDQKIISSGIYVDMDLVKAAIALDEAEKKRLKSNIINLSLGMIENPKSNKQITDYLAEVLPIEVKSINKENTSKLLKFCKDEGFDTEYQILQSRSQLNKTSLAKYYRIDEMTCKDGRVRGLLQFYGSRTGRWAGRGVQVQNLPRNYLSCLSTARDLIKSKNFEGLKLLYAEEPSDIASQLIRTVFIPSPGKTFAVADYSAIEARVIAWLAGEKWRMEAFKNGQDIYCVSASHMFNVPVESILDKNNPNHALRAQGKVAELALGYGGAVGAIARMDFNNDIPESERQNIVNTWRNKSPKIVGLWNRLDTMCRLAYRDPGKRKFVNEYISVIVENDYLKIKLPSGRELFYPEIHMGEEGLEFLGTNQLSRKIEATRMYGGKWTENCVQAIARDCLSEALVRLDQAGFEIKFHVHDEVILEVDRNKADEQLDLAMAIMCEPPNWAPGLILDAAGFTSEFYKKD